MASLRLKFYSVAWNFRQRFFCRMTIVLWKQISASRGDLNFCLCSSIREWIQMKSKVLKSCIQNDSEMKTSISGRSERIGFHLTEGNKSSRGFFFQRELNFVLRGLSANPQNSLQNFLSTLYLSLFFLLSFFVAFWNCLIYAKCYDIFCILNVQTEFLSIHRENEIN